MIGFTEYKQGLHDILANTYVVTNHWEGPVPLEDNFWRIIMENTQEEQKWAIGTLAMFVILLIISGISDFVEVGIGVCTFLFSWLCKLFDKEFWKGWHF